MQQRSLFLASLTSRPTSSTMMGTFEHVLFFPKVRKVAMCASTSVSGRDPNRGSVLMVFIGVWSPSYLVLCKNHS